MAFSKSIVGLFFGGAFFLSLVARADLVSVTPRTVGTLGPVVLSLSYTQEYLMGVPGFVCATNDSLCVMTVVNVEMTHSSGGGLALNSIEVGRIKASALSTFNRSSWVNGSIKVTGVDAVGATRIEFASLDGATVVSDNCYPSAGSPSCFLSNLTARWAGSDVSDTSGVAQDRNYWNLEIATALKPGIYLIKVYYSNGGLKQSVLNIQSYL